MKLFYISFATPTEFLGATVLESHSKFSVLAEACKHGLYPGGQAAIMEIPYELLDKPDVRMLQGKLFNKEQMQAIGASRHGDLDEETRVAIESHIVVVGG